VNFEPKIRL